MKFNIYTFFLLLVTSLPLSAIESTPMKPWVTDYFSTSIPSEYQIEKSKNGIEFRAAMKSMGNNGLVEVIAIKILSLDEFDKDINDTRQKLIAAGYPTEDNSCGLDCNIFKYEISGIKGNKESTLVSIFTRMPDQAFAILFLANALETKTKTLLTILEQEIRSSYNVNWAKVGGNSYEGEFLNGKFLGGNGVQRYSNGSVYKGDINDEKLPHGNGKITYKDKTYISGQFKDGEFHGGQGQIKFSGSRSYNGRLNGNKKPDGRGTMWVSNGGYVEGQFSNGVFQGGNGNLIYNNDEKYLSYTGNLDKDMNPTGKGSYKYTKAEKARRWEALAAQRANNSLHSTSSDDETVNYNDAMSDIMDLVNMTPEEKNKKKEAERKALLDRKFEARDQEIDYQSILEGLGGANQSSLSCPAGYKYVCGDTCCNTQMCCGNSCLAAGESCPWGYEKTKALYAQ